jgi:UDP-N-acetylglucosamine acyltransferase
MVRAASFRDIHQNGSAMANSQTSRIHPSAIISPEAELAADVDVGPYVVIEGRVRIGPGCILRPFAHLCGPLTMGRSNMVYSGTVLGESPQHLRYNNEATGVEIGDCNIFRENVTIHRGTTQSWTTRIGNHNYFMANAHVAHDCHIGNHCILANGALVGGHCTLHDGAYLSGNCAVHQFVRIGRLALLSGCSGSTKDIPPFIIQQNIDTVVGVNVVGMHRAGIPSDQIDAVRRAFRILFRQGMIIPAALQQIEQELGHVEVVAEFVSFIRGSKRGINPVRGRNRDAA